MKTLLSRPAAHPGGWGFVLACAWLATTLSAAEPAPLALENRHMRLEFDAGTGAWISLIDKSNGDNLVGSPRPTCMVPNAAPRTLDRERIAHLLATHQALDLAGAWEYTPEPVKDAASARVLAGDMAAVAWAPTPVPSQGDAGDRRLHERVGEFWYRHNFTCPAEWTQGDVVLILGAVDDFDTTYINGAFVGNTGQETPQFWIAPRWYRFPASRLKPGQTNSILIKVTNGASDGGIAGPVVLCPAALLTGQAQVPGLAGHDWLRRNRQLRMSVRQDGWEYSLEYTLEDNAPAFSRRCEVKNITPQEQVLETSVAVTPPFALGDACGVSFPGSLPVGDQAVSTLPDGGALSSHGQDPLVVLWDAQGKRGLGAWYHCEEEFTPVSVKRLGTAVEIRHSQPILARLSPGQSVLLGRQYFWLAHGDRDAVLRGVQPVYEKIGLRAPPQALPGLRSKVMYCGHPGGMPEKGYMGYGGFKAFQDYLPTLHAMGVDLLWFLPIWEHGDGRKWNLYSPFDHFQVSPLYGTTNELRDLAEMAAGEGIRLMFDLVPHGPPDITPLARAHVDYVCRDRDGALHYEWGQYAFDNAHPGWQTYMRQASAWGAEQFLAVGARVDCAAGSSPNWNRALGWRPSSSTLGGGLGMCRAIRAGYLDRHPSVVLLPEEYTSANIYSRVADVTYDAQLYFLLMDLNDRKASPVEWARTLQQFLHDQSLTLPPGALKMRWISNHDTVSWTFQKMRPVRAYGVDRLRALMALCAFIDGVPMLYQGDENPALYGGQGETHTGYLATVYPLRKTIPALRDGGADYQAVQATGGVFACLRQARRDRALVLINLNTEPVTTTVTTRLSLPNSWRDARTGDKLDLREPVPMQPGQARLLTVQ